MFNLLSSTLVAEWYHYALIIFVALMAAVKVAFQNDFSHKYGKNIADMSFFMSFAFVLIAIMVCFTIDFSILPGWETIAMGVAFGLIASVTQVIYTFAMKSGPISLTVLITNFAFVVAVVVGAIFWNEQINIYKWIAFVILAVAMVLILYKKPITDATKLEGENKKDSKNLIWIILTALSFAGMAINMLIQVWHQHIPSIKAEFSWFVFISYVVSFVTSLITIPFTKQKLSFKINKRIICDIIFCAIALGLHNYIKPLLNNYVENNILQPMSAICLIMFTTMFGLILFKDKIRKTQWVGIVLGIVATVLLCI